MLSRAAFPFLKICASSSNQTQFLSPAIIEAKTANRNFDRRQLLLEAKSVLNTCDEALDLYLEIGQKYEPAVDSMESLILIDGILTHLKDSIRSYEKSPKPVNRWCAKTTPILTTYKDGESTQPDNLLKALKDGKVIMNDAQKMVWDSKKSFNTVLGNLVSLKTSLGFEFDKNVENDALKALVSELNQKVASIREFVEAFAYSNDKVAIAIDDIIKVKEATMHAETFVSIYHEFHDLHDETIQSVDNLIEACNSYRKEYVL